MPSFANEPLPDASGASELSLRAGCPIAAATHRPGAASWKTVVLLASLGSVDAAQGGDDLLAALASGHFDLFLRYRFEYVEDGKPGLQRAYASTLRSALGYRTADFHGASLALQLEDVRVVGDELYNDGGSNGLTDRAVVPDPEGLEVNQAYLRFGGVPRTVLTAGRQQIAHRQAPLQRFVGDQSWRQNFQSFEAVRLVSLALPGAIADYAYVWNVNRVLGEGNRLPDGSDYPMDSHFFNLQYSGLDFAKLEGYAYLLDFTTQASARFSTATFGLRLAGDRVVLPKAKLSYAGEYAFQAGYGDNPDSVGVSYALGELGVGYSFGGFLEAASLKLGYEELGGNGKGEAFQTPLATLHAFQGFADRFLATPSDGVRDCYAALGLKLLGGQLGAIYHRFLSDRDGYAYGDEWDIVFERPIEEHFLFGLKYADYRAGRNPENLARNSAGGQAFDLAKFWTYLQFTY